MKLKVASTLGLLALMSATASLPAIAQDNNANAPMAPAAVPVTVDVNGVPTYTTWQTGWDANQFDRKHVILGTVADFKPFRLQVSRPDGPTQTIDLKNGTTILPTGMTPMANQRVAIVGYYSNGTFIANRVILHG